MASLNASAAYTRTDTHSTSSSPTTTRTRHKLDTSSPLSVRSLSRISTDEVFTAITFPSPTHGSCASPWCADSRLRVVSPSSDSLGGGEMSLSAGGHLSAALDMKAKSAAAAVAVDLLHSGAPSAQSQSQKIKKSRIFQSTIASKDNINTTSATIADWNKHQALVDSSESQPIRPTTICPKLLRSCRSRGSQRRQRQQPQIMPLQRRQKQLQQHQRKPKHVRQQQKHLDKQFRLEQERQLAEAEELQQQQQQLYASTKENFLLTLDLLAVVRRNASDKLRLIQMVHDNPILWDSRLPNFKGAEEEKNRAWEMIGKEFSAPGRRVARAFKSLRESYRRELAHVKLMGNGFKPKWSLYDAMDFLRDVIRERKGGSHAAEQSAIGLNLSAFSQHLNNNNTKTTLKLSALHSSFSETTALNLSKCATGMNMSHEDYYYYVKPELDMSAVQTGSNGFSGAGGGGTAPHPLPAHQSQQMSQQQQQLQQHAAHDSRVSSTRNDNTTQHSPTFDDLDASSVRSGDETSMRNADISNQGSDEVEELEAIDADFPYPLILDANSPRSTNAAGGGVGGSSGVGVGGATKRKRRDMNGDAMDGGDEEDDYDGQMMQQHRHLRQQNGGTNGGGGMGGMSNCILDMPPPQTVREVLNSKFCGFISAKLNSMEDTEADNLMNKILMLLVQTQGNEAK